MASISLLFAAMTAADLVQTELNLSSKAPRPQSSVIDVDAVFSTSVANYCSIGDRVIFTKLDKDERWTVNALGSIISVTAILVTTGQPCAAGPLPREPADRNRYGHRFHHRQGAPRAPCASGALTMFTAAAQPEGSPEGHIG